MNWWTSIVVVGVILLNRESMCKQYKDLWFQLMDPDLTAKEGSCVQIQCEGNIPWYMGHPKLLWLKNAQYNHSSRNFYGTMVYSNDNKRSPHPDFEGRVRYIGQSLSQTSEKNCSIQICCLSMNDNGNYSFRFEGNNQSYRYHIDKAGKDRYHTVMARLQVQENPCKVRFEASARNLTESDQAKFTCSTSSLCSKKPQIKGLPVSNSVQNNETSTVATLVASSMDHQRQLSCFVPGLDECLHQNISLTVQYSPKNLTLDGTKKRVELNGSLTLHCSADAVPAPTEYTWYFNPDSMNWPTHSQFNRTSTRNNKLEIQYVAKTDHGCYRCSATNTQGQGEKSNSFCVEVLFAPMKPVLSVATLATEGDVISINCSVVSWPLPSSLKLTWATGDRSILRVLHHVSNTSSLTATLNVTLDSAGHYACTAQNSQGFNKCEQKLTVNYAPQNVSVKFKGGLVLKENQTLELFCEARSVPPIHSYSWTRTSAAQKETVGCNQTLTIKSVSPSDCGWYSCIANNTVGSRRSPAVHVEVEYAPKYANITGMKGDEYDAHDPVQLSCHGISFPPPWRYIWYKQLNNKSNEQVVQNHQNLTVDLDHPGIYHCYLENLEGGTASKTVRLFLKTWRPKEIFWAIPFVCLLVLVVITYLVCRHKRKKLVSERAVDPLPRPVHYLVDDARGSRDDLLPNHAPYRPDHTSSHTDHAPSQAPQCSAASPERVSSSISNIVYSTINLPAGVQAIREDHGYADSEVNYASLHFPSQGRSQGTSPPAAMENDVYAKIANKNYENLDGENNQLGDIELNYSQVTFTAKQKTKTTR